MNDLPGTLFKYFSPERLDSLATCELAFSPRTAFNDPFEGRPEITGVSSHSYLREQVLKGLDENELAALYSKLPDEVQRRLSPGAFEQYARAYIERELDPQLEKHKPLLDKLAQTFPIELDKNVGVLCLCEVSDSLLMWAHYASSHTGFVVEYDANHPYFHSARGANDEFFHLRRVLYRGARPSAPLIDLDAQAVFLTKSDHWSYEKEWRMMKPLSFADRTIQRSQGAVYLFNFPPELIRSVILGARASEEIVASARAILNSNPGYRDVKLQQTYPDPSHFLLRFRELDREA